MEHSHWTHWKMRHGLAIHGRAIAPLKPIGLFAFFFYWVYFKWAESPPVTDKVNED